MGNRGLDERHPIPSVPCPIHKNPQIGKNDEQFEDCATWVEQRQSGAKIPADGCSHLYKATSNYDGEFLYYAHYCNDECYKQDHEDEPEDEPQHMSSAASRKLKLITSDHAYEPWAHITPTKMNGLPSRNHD